ncbi:MAG TPA: hypothetical protein VL242_53255 [Sorangium sp.]|nr:hypothetical protein [Sorangium sp.]
MLQKVRIRGFKTIVDVTWELGKFNVFIGPSLYASHAPSFWPRLSPTSFDS